ncbi:MAG: hypothetical protein Fur0027_14540 [Raineya sp.]
MDFGIVKEVVTVLVAGLGAWGIMRERMLKNELKNEQLQKEFDKFQESHEEHKNRMYEILKSISEQQQKILLILERNNVR